MGEFTNSFLESHSNWAQQGRPSITLVGVVKLALSSSVDKDWLMSNKQLNLFKDFIATILLQGCAELGNEGNESEHFREKN
jgi:hypothetical protein